MQTAMAYLLVFFLIIQCFGSSFGWAERQDENEQFLDPRTIALRQMVPSRLLKRTPWDIEKKAMRNFKNCYFSPIQCVLLERRRRR